jgi:hypothetical protein
MNAELILSAILILVALLLFFTRRQQRSDRHVALRPLSAIAALDDQLGEAIESGRQLHVSLGQGGLTGTATPTSVAAVHILNHLAQEGSASGAAPLATVGEGVMLPLAQESLRRAHDEVGRIRDYKPSMAQFVAVETDPYAFAAGVSSVIQQNQAGGNVLVGRFGPEIAIIAEAAARQNLKQVIGTDDPSALAAATAVTGDLLVGEELFAADAYLIGSPSQIASLQVQDVLRAIIAAVILILALVNYLNG